MSFTNVGAFVDGQRPKSKKAVREALADDPYRVTFDPTSPFDPAYGTVLAGADLGTILAGGHKLTLVGPDPETKRNFFGTVELKTVRGELRVVVS
jgi:hypothetical protein